MDERTESTPKVPVWTGEPVKDRTNLNKYIRSVGRTLGASPERVEAVIHVGDALLDSTQDDHEAFQNLESQVYEQFDGPDEEYLFLTALFDASQQGM